MVAIEDNGPGIVAAQVAKIFGKLLYGSKFHRLRQSRGQQGIGISAAGMYGQQTTGKAGASILTRTGPRKKRAANYFEIAPRREGQQARREASRRTREWDKDAAGRASSSR